MALEYILKKIAHFQIKHPYLTVLFILALTLMIWGGVSKVQTVASLEKMMPYDIEEIESINILRDYGLGQDMIAVVLSIDKDSADSSTIQDITDYEVYSYLKDLKTEVEKESSILNSYSYAEVVGFYSNYENLTYNEVFENEIALKQISKFVNDDKTITMIIFSTDVAANDEKMILLSNQIKGVIDSMGNPRGVKIELTGTPIIQQKLGTLISQDRTNTQWISMLLVFTITALIFRSFLLPIVPLLVVFTSVNWLYGTMGYTNLPISTLAGGVAAMVIGIGIDFAIHIMNKFKYERKQNKPIPESIELAVVHTGSALFATSLTTIVAFLAFLVGAMPEMGRFGILMAIGIFYSLIFSVFGLPALLVIEEKIIYRFKKNATFGIEKEFHLEENTK